MNVIGFAQFIRRPSIIAAVAALALIPATIALEKAKPDLWQERLVLPSFTKEVSRHTPRAFTGTFLPPVILTSRSLESADSPIILTRSTRIPRGVTLTIGPGTQIVAHENASFVVEGTFVVNGTAANQVVFTTNEENTVNQTWSGIVFKGGGRGTIQYANIKYGSPAISCEVDSAAVIQHTTLQLGNLGLFSQSPNCSLSQSAITNVDVGVISHLKNIALIGATIKARIEDIQTIRTNNLPFPGSTPDY